MRYNRYFHEYIEKTSEPDPEPEQEFYYRTFEELCQLLGEEKAQEKVEMYQQLSKQYASNPNWIIHRCRLLATYQKRHLIPITL